MGEINKTDVLKVASSRVCSGAVLVAHFLPCKIKGSKGAFLDSFLSLALPSMAGN